MALVGRPAAAQRTTAVPGTHAAAAASPSAQGTQGTVVAIDSGDLVVDLGAARGAYDGEVVELWRPIRLRHPVTGQVLTDRFRIGNVRLTQVQSTLALAKVEGETARPPATGDVVVVPESARREPPPPAVPPLQKPEPSAPQMATAPARIVVPQDPDAQALSDLFAALEGSAPQARAHAYEQFVRAHPKSRFANVLREEIEALRSAQRRASPYEKSEPAFDRLRPGTPQQYAIELDPRFVGAVVHVRRKGAATGYRSLPMQSVGARYWTATLPGDAIAEPGMQYFVEGVTEEGAPVAIVGSADTPRDVTVDPRPLAGKNPETLAQITMQSEYASFNAKKANDWMFQTEGTFGWRLHDVGVRAVRSGFGVLRGKGGSLQDLDELGKDPRAVGLTYGYVELEVAMSTNYALVGRPIIGLRDAGVAGGAQGFFRVGNDLRTNLLVGGEVLGSVGLRGIVQLEWRTIPRVPIAVRTEVTNQPAGSGGDVGARAIGQVGYELVRDFTLSGRVSYQGRTINHAGPGAGLAVSYQW
jgi:hypothetical protein